MITIVDYGMGNLGSVFNMLKKIGVEAEITHDLDRIALARKIILPGVGSFDAAMERIQQGGYKEVLDQKALIQKIPILGICLGMQLLSASSEEGQLPGLAWIKGKTVKFAFEQGLALRIPHMGWNQISPTRTHPLVEHLPTDPRFYFVHSYHVELEDFSKNSLATTDYGIRFNAMIQHENIMGAQFHPEKSHSYGMKLLKNFAAI